MAAKPLDFKKDSLEAERRGREEARSLDVQKGTASQRP